MNIFNISGRFYIKPKSKSDIENRSSVTPSLIALSALHWHLSIKCRLGMSSGWCVNKLSYFSNVSLGFYHITSKMELLNPDRDLIETLDKQKIEIA